MEPLVSVVVTAHAGAGPLARSVGGAVAQDYPADRLEILVVDDGATDAAANEAALAPFGERVRLVRKRAGAPGVAAARNHGIRQAGGDLVALLDAGDAWRPAKTRKQVDFLARHPDYGMVLCDMELCDAAGARLEAAPRRPQLPRDGMVLDDVLMQPRLGPSSAMIRRPAFAAVGFFDESLRAAEDVDFMLRLAREVPIGLVEETLATCTRGAADDTSSADYMRVMRGFVALHAKQIDPRVAHQALMRAGLRNAIGLAAAGRGREAARLYAEAVLHARDSRDLAEVARESVKIGVVLGRAVTRARPI